MTEQRRNHQQVFALTLLIFAGLGTYSNIVCVAQNPGRRKLCRMHVTWQYFTHVAKSQILQSMYLLC